MVIGVVVGVCECLKMVKMTISIWNNRRIAICIYLAYKKTLEPSNK